MPTIIHGILDESRDYYRIMKRESVGQLLINQRGHIKRQVIDGNAYVILRKSINGKPIDTYIGKENSMLAKKITEENARSKRAIINLRSSKQAMKELNVPNIEISREDFFPIVKNIFDEFSNMGLWEEGLEVVGSWCFKIYQNYCGVGYYPDRTLDIDFAIKIPYSGNPTNIGKMLKELGFLEEFNYGDGSITYKSGDFKIEFLKNRTGDGRVRNETSQEGRDLGIIPQALPYMNILLENPMTITARDIGTVVVPTMPAFMLHKLIVAERRNKENKRHKDYRQSDAVAKVIVSNTDLIEATGRIFADLHKSWRGNITKSAKQLVKNYPWQSGAVMAILDQIT